MKNNPLVSVIIPNYNHALYLKERIESVLEQSFQDFELYILDDCSSDNSLQIINSFKAYDQVKGIIKNDKNSGSLFKQWVKGIKLAQGKYLWIAESDDFSHIDFLKETIDLAEQNDNVGFVFTDSNIVDFNSKVIGQTSTSNKALATFIEKKVGNIFNKNNLLDYFISDLVVWNASSVLFRTESLKKVDFIILEHLKNAGDLFTYISIALKNDIIYVNKPLNNFRTHEKNTTAKNIASGAIFNDRIIIIKYFVRNLLELEAGGLHLKTFIRRIFLTSVDFKFYGQTRSLLKVYLKYNIISFYIYFQLSGYVCYFRLFKKAPHVYRAYIKKILKKI